MRGRWSRFRNQSKPFPQCGGLLRRRFRLRDGLLLLLRRGHGLRMRWAGLPVQFWRHFRPARTLQFPLCQHSHLGLTHSLRFLRTYLLRTYLLLRLPSPSPSREPCLRCLLLLCPLPSPSPSSLLHGCKHLRRHLLAHSRGLSGLSLRLFRLSRGFGLPLQPGAFSNAHKMNIGRLTDLLSRPG